MLRLSRIAFLVSALALSSFSWGNPQANDEAALTPARKTELMNILRQDCGSCHGLLFKGGLGVPLTPEALSGKPLEALRDAILDGRDGTTMPPWRPFLTEAEAEWMVKMLMKGLR